MRFTAKRSRLAEVASLVGQAVAGKSTKKIFECLRIVAKDGELEFAGTDLEVAVRYRMTEDEEVEIAEPGEVVVPAHLFANVLREIGDESISLAVARQKLALETDGGFFELECEDPAQYPEIPPFPEAASCSLAATDLRALVRKTSFAAGKEAARFVLNGVRILAEADTLRFVATDGRRLAMLCRPLVRKNGAEGREIGSIVGVKGLHHFERIAAEVEGDVEFAVAERFVALRTEKAEVVVRVMEGTFPDYGQIMPKDCPGEASLPVGVFMSKLRQARQFASVESQAVALAFKPGELAISAAGGDGRAEVKLGVDYDGETERIGFNPAYILEALKVVDGEQVRFAFKNANSAARLEDEAGFLYVIMPVMID
ncbi:MAG: DNA polymerase III subunit beta [Planctomycetota bacterium]|jgi:DNA polymerase-3 subunit beta